MGEDAVLDLMFADDFLGYRKHPKDCCKGGGGDPHHRLDGDSGGGSGGGASGAGGGSGRCHWSSSGRDNRAVAATLVKATADGGMEREAVPTGTARRPPSTRLLPRVQTTAR